MKVSSILLLLASLLTEAKGISPAEARIYFDWSDHQRDIGNDVEDRSNNNPLSHQCPEPCHCLGDVSVINCAFQNLTSIPTSSTSGRDLNATDIL